VAGCDLAQQCCPGAPGSSEIPPATANIRTSPLRAKCGRLLPLAKISSQYSIRIEPIFALAATVPRRRQADSSSSPKLVFIVLKNLRILRIWYVLM
jgi:hypothetical protein